MHCNHRRPEHTACDSLQDFGEGDERKAGPKPEDQDTQGDGHYTSRHQQAFRPHAIHELAARHLTLPGPMLRAKPMSSALQPWTTR